MNDCSVVNAIVIHSVSIVLPQILRRYWVDCAL